MLAHVPRSNTDTQSPCHHRVVQYRLVSGRTAPVLFACRTSTPHFIVRYTSAMYMAGYPHVRFPRLDIGQLLAPRSTPLAIAANKYLVTGPVLDASSSSCTDPIHLWMNLVAPRHIRVTMVGLRSHRPLLGPAEDTSPWSWYDPTLEGLVRLYGSPSSNPGRDRSFEFALLACRSVC